MKSVLDREDLNVKIILVLREEYFTHLDQFEEQVASVFNSRVRLERMTNDTLLTVVDGITTAGDVVIDAADKTALQQNIINNIANAQQIVELPYLQVYLDKLNNKAEVRNGQKVFDEKLVQSVGHLEDVLGDFLEEQVQLISQETGAKDLVWSILKILITSEGTKRPLSLEQLVQQVQKATKV